jgi:hypothetical protein
VTVPSAGRWTVDATGPDLESFVEEIGAWLMEEASPTARVDHPALTWALPVWIEAAQRRAVDPVAVIGVGPPGDAARRSGDAGSPMAWASTDRIGRWLADALSLEWGSRTVRRHVVTREEAARDPRRLGGELADLLSLAPTDDAFQALGTLGPERSVGDAIAEGDRRSPDVDVLARRTHAVLRRLAAPRSGVSIDARHLATLDDVRRDHEALIVAGTPVTNVSAPLSTLRPGDRGPLVRRLQTLLGTYGYDLVVNGHVDGPTMSALAEAVGGDPAASGIACDAGGWAALLGGRATVRAT